MVKSQDRLYYEYEAVTKKLLQQNKKKYDLSKILLTPKEPEYYDSFERTGIGIFVVREEPYTIFPNITVASKETGIDHHRISSICKGKARRIRIDESLWRYATPKEIEEYKNAKENN